MYSERLHTQNYRRVAYCELGGVMKMQHNHEMIKTTTVFHKSLVEEIEQSNPFKTRREFFEVACRRYLHELKKEWAYQQLEKACLESAAEDILVNSQWEGSTLENWK